MNRLFCVDSSVIVKWLVPDEETDRARALFDRITARQGKIIVPSLAWAEIGSTLRKKVRQRLIEPSEADKLWSVFRSLGNIHSMDWPEVAERA